MKKKTQTNTNEVNEPVTTFANNEIRFFSSFEEMNEADAEEQAKISPIDSLILTTELIERLYANELSKKINSYIIYFK